VPRLGLRSVPLDEVDDLEVRRRRALREVDLGLLECHVGLLFYPRRMFPADRMTLPKIAQTADALPGSVGKGVVSGTTDLFPRPAQQSRLF
jgi:hypothetical protein